MRGVEPLPPDCDPTAHLPAAEQRTLLHVDRPTLTPEEASRIDRELAAFAREESRKLGLVRDQWIEPIHNRFTPEQRPHTTILISGLTLTHDRLCGAGLRGMGYAVETLDCPDTVALQFGKEFGNRGQCNPTYYTVGNLIKHLACLRDDRGMPTSDILDRYVFLTAGACGPCRFGAYVTEYRKALREAGFDGFRVLLFQQQGGIRQATGEGLGLQINLRFAFQVVRAMIAGDVLNLLGYRLRPYEQVPGATSAALAACQEVLALALETNASLARALYRCRCLLGRITVDRTVPKPVVSIIGEFWAMTTEGDGSYHLQSFLEREGAEVDIQGVTNWLLFMLWENRHDTRQRLVLRQADSARKGLKGTRPIRKLVTLRLAEWAVRGTFQLYANLIGLHRYRLPDMDHIARLAARHYDNNVRGGEGHMEVGKLIHFVEDRVNHMTVSIKPFGCMPSSGVSDGVQSFVTARWPEAIFIPIETTGDAQVNALSRVQMMLFKARQKARAEFREALTAVGMDEESFRARVRKRRCWRHPFSRPPHHAAGIATNLVYAVSRAAFLPRFFRIPRR